MARCLSVVLVGWVALFSSGNAAGETIAFDSERWKLTNGRVEEYLGRKSLVGGAVLQDVEFADGVIEIDIAADGRRCFPGIEFRAQDAENLEVFYIRPHKPNSPDALQYTPTYDGLSGWQLYHGRGYTAAVDVPHNLLFIDRQSRSVEAVIELGPGLVDGVEADGEGGYIVSQYDGRVLRVEPSGEIQVLVDATEAPIYCADLDYVPERSLLVVPSLMGGGLVAYEVAAHGAH